MLMEFKRDEDFVPVEYSEEEKAFRSQIISEMEESRNVRNDSHIEFDDMTYLEFHEFNAKAGNAYNRPKTNRQDVRTTTGTTLEKKNSLLANIMNLNLEPTISAWDKNNSFVNEMGKTMESMVKKSYSIENPDFDAKELIIMNEFFDQGTVFVEDSVQEFKIPDKTVVTFDPKDLSKTKWTERMGKVTKSMTTNLLSGPNVYLGNFKEPFMQMQPFVIRRRILHRSRARSIYQEWERWKSVPQTMDAYEDIDVPYNDWTLEEYQNDYVEELFYYSKWDNNFMIVLNGVMMFPVKNEKGRLSTIPLSSINGVCEYPISKGILEPIENCAYGRSIPSKTKVDQAIFDEMVRLMILKTQQSFMPPMINNTGHTISSKAFYPANIIDNVNPDKLKPIIPANGVSSAELNVIQFIKSIIDQKSISSTFQGQESTGSQTATEASIQQRQSLMGLGLTIAGVINLKKSMTKIRIHSIIKNWAEEKKTIEMDAEFEEGQSGQQIVEFNDEVPHPNQIFAEEELLEKLRGGKFRKTVISPAQLRKMGLMWKTDIVPTPKDTTDLRRAQFESSVAKALQLFAPAGKMLNLDYIGERWAILQGEDPDRYWAKEQPQELAPELAGQAVPQGGAAPAGPNPQPAQLPAPTVNTLQGQA